MVCMTYLLNQITMPSSGPKFVNVFDDGGNEVLSVDVSTSTDVIYSGDTLTITTSTSFFTSRMYYLLADSGMCVCVCVDLCNYECVCMFMRTDKWAGMHTWLPACMLMCTCESVYVRECIQISLTPSLCVSAVYVCVCMCVCMCL